MTTSSDKAKWPDLVLRCQVTPMIHAVHAPPLQQLLQPLLTCATLIQLLCTTRDQLDELLDLLEDNGMQLPEITVPICQAKQQLQTALLQLRLHKFIQMMQLQSRLRNYMRQHANVPALDFDAMA